MAAESREGWGQDRRIEIPHTAYKGDAEDNFLNTSSRGTS